MSEGPTVEELVRKMYRASKRTERDLEELKPEPGTPEAELLRNLRAINADYERMRPRPEAPPRRRLRRDR